MPTSRGEVAPGGSGLGSRRGRVRPLLTWFAQRRAAFQLPYDLAAWPVAICFARLMRWDFTGADWLSDNPSYWLGDTAHFSPEVARMMLARIFGEPMPPGWERFGRLRVR